MNPTGQGIDLSGLRDIHLPPLPSVWPLAWGWWALAGIAVLICVAVWLLMKKKRMNAKKYALREIDSLCQKYAEDPHRLASELSLLLKRVALIRFPREQVAGAYGKQWREFLQKTSQKPLFNGKSAEILETVMYVPKGAVTVKDAADLAKSAKEWIIEHA